MGEKERVDVPGLGPGMRERGIDPGRGRKALWARAKELVWRDSKNPPLFPSNTI